MNPLNNLIIALKKDINLPMVIKDNNILKISLNFFVNKNIKLVDNNFFIYNTYFISMLSPFFSLLSAYDYRQKKTIDEKIITFLQKEGFKYGGILNLN
jgi:hypothetical protein